MKHKNTKDLYNYWNELRGNQAAPERSAVEPASIRHLLKDTFILQVDSVEKFHFRLAGTRTCSLFGQEIKNKNLLDLVSEDSQEAIQTLLYSISDDASAVICGMKATSIQGDDMPLEMLLLPLKLNGAMDERIIGCISPIKMPYWAGGIAVESLSLTSVRILMPHDHEKALGKTIPKLPNLQPAQEINSVVSQGFLERHYGAKRVAHLTVLDGGIQ